MELRRLSPTHQKWLVYAALLTICFAVIFASFFTAATPDLAAIRAVKQAVGPEAGAIRVSGRYQFEDIDGAVSSDLQLACGTVVQQQEARSFAVLVRRTGGNRAVYIAEELAIMPGGVRTPLPRETQLLGACEG